MGTRTLPSVQDDWCAWLPREKDQAYSEFVRQLESSFGAHTEAKERFSAHADGGSFRVHFTQVEGEPRDPEVEFRPVEQLESDRAALSVIAGYCIFKRRRKSWRD